MNVSMIGKTVKQIIFGDFRILRVDDDGRAEVVFPAGTTGDVNVAKIAGTATENGGIAGLLGAGINRVGGAILAAAGRAGVLPVAGATAHDAAAGTEYPVLTGTEVALIEQTAMAVGDRSKSFSDPYGNTKVVSRSHDYGIQAERTAEIAPINMRFDPIYFSRPNITNGAWVYDYFSMDGALSFALQFLATITGGDALQMVVGITLQDDSTVPASCSYEDITAQLNGGAPFITASKTVQANIPIGAKYVRVGYYVTGGNTTDVIVHGKRWY